MSLFLILQRRVSNRRRPKRFWRALRLFKVDAPSTKEFYDFRMEIKGEISGMRQEMIQLRSELREDMKEMEIRIERGLSEFQINLFKWLVPILLGQAGLIVALMKLI
jgi:hypothetical protein